MQARHAFAALTLCACALPVRGAIFSNLVEQGKIATSSQQFRTLANGRDMAPEQHIGLSALGDDAISALILTGSQGRLSLNTHSCSGPPPGSAAGNANASGQLYYEEDFVIRSDTLAVGTPVTIKVKIAAGSSFIGTTTNPNNLPTFDSAGVEGSANIRIDSNLLSEATFIGSLNGGQQGGFPSSRTRNGIFATTPVDPTDEPGERRAGEFTVDVGGKVGQRFNIAINTSMTTASNAGVTSVSDADGQISILWGFDVVGGLAEIVTPGGDFVAPPTSNATDDRALIFLPLSPLFPEPASLAVLCAPALLLCRCRRSRHA